MWGWLIVGLSGVMYISTQRREKQRFSRMLKPATIIFLLLTFLFVPHLHAHHHVHIYWVIGGLILSVVSDILLVLPSPKIQKSFYIRMVSFAAYSLYFWGELQGHITWWLPALLFASGVIIFLLLLPKLDVLVFPVTIMGILLLQMAWAAGTVWLNHSTTANLLAFISALGFVIAALIRALYGHHQREANLDLYITLFYFASQVLLVRSAML